MKIRSKALSAIIRAAREKQYPRAQDFHEKFAKLLQISYPQYIAIETATRFPQPKALLAIAKALDLNSRKLIHLWCREQMPDDHSKSFFEEYFGDDSPAIKKDIEALYVFQDGQAKAMLQNPAIWLVLCFVGHFWKAHAVTEALAKEALGLPDKQFTTALKWLMNEGVIKESDGLLKVTKEYFHIPFHSDAYREVRNNNFRILSGKVLQSITTDAIRAGEAARYTVTGRYSTEEAKKITSKILELQSYISSLSDSGNELYAFCVAFDSVVKPAIKKGKGER